MVGRQQWARLYPQWGCDFTDSLFLHTDWWGEASPPDDQGERNEVDETPNTLVITIRSHVFSVAPICDTHVVVGVIPARNLHIRDRRSRQEALDQLHDAGRQHVLLNN